MIEFIFNLNLTKQMKKKTQRIEIPKQVKYVGSYWILGILTEIINMVS